MKNNIVKTLLEISIIRFIRSFFYVKARLFFKYFYYILLFSFIVFIPYYSYKNQQDITRFKNKVVNQYIGFIDKDKSSYSKIIIRGNNHTDYNDVSQIIRSQIDIFSKNKDSYLESVISVVKNNIIELPWVKNVVISRTLPNDLNVLIEEHEPFAIWQDNNIKYIIDKEGSIIIKIKDENTFSDLLILSGANANIRAKSLFNILVSDLVISQDIYSATLIGLRRWDIRFNNGLLVKLPELDIKKAWKNMIRIYNETGSLVGLESIDLRINGKIYLQYSDKIIKDLKSL